MEYLCCDFAFHCSGCDSDQVVSSEEFRAERDVIYGIDAFGRRRSEQEHLHVILECPGCRQEFQL